MNYFQITLLLLEGALVAFVILLLFHLRRQLGIGVLFACLGLFQFMQVFLSSTVYVSIYGSFIVSPGSSVLFTATLFALLIIYIKEDASETKKIIYALIIVNLLMSVLIHSFSWNFKDSYTYNPFNVSKNLFDNNAWVLIVGTIALFIDSLLIIILFEFFSGYIRNLFLNIFITMLLVISFDTVFFSVISFWNFSNLGNILLSGFISKGVFALIYSIIFYLYLKYFDLKKVTTSKFRVKDVFQPLTYRQKYESAAIQIQKKEELLEMKEIRYQTLTDISPVGVFHTLRDGYTTYVNPKWCEISGVKQSDAVGWGWLSAVHPDDRIIIQKEWDSAIEEKRISRINYRFVLPDGSVKWVLGQVVPEYYNQDEIIGFVGTITDITEIKLYEQEQILLRKKADESSRLKSAFLANMSHEIRTPMNGILGFADLLQEPDLSVELQKDYLELIKQSGARMLNTIKDIISISNIEAGLEELCIQDLNVNEQLEYFYKIFKPEADAKKLNFSFKPYLPSESSIIKTDRDKFNSVLTKLINNALKYTDSGSIEFGYLEKPGILEFYVKDTGIGISAERVHAIFDRFVQADIEDKMAKQGSGLGLSISKAYVEMLGGKISVVSEEGKGSAFYFTIPFSGAASGTKSSSLISNDELIENKIKKLKVLVVEDDEMSVMLINKMLEKEHHEILHSTNGIDAVAKCKLNPDIDLVLMDIKLPQMNGHEAARKIREFNKDVIIFAQTAYAPKGDKQKSIDAGCNEHITKPIIKSELYSILERYFSIS